MHAYNELARAEATSPLTLLIRQFRNVLIIALLGASLLSALVGELLLIALLVRIPAVRQAFCITLPSLADLALIATISLIVFAII